MSANDLSALSISINGSQPELNSDLALLPANRTNSPTPQTSEMAFAEFSNHEVQESASSSPGLSSATTPPFRSSGNSSPKSRNSDDMPMPVRSYSKWAPSEHGSTLVWRDVCVYAKCPQKGSKAGLKRIINNATGAIQPGTLMALMGSRYEYLYIILVLCKSECKVKLYTWLIWQICENVTKDIICVT